MIGVGASRMKAAVSILVILVVLVAVGGLGSPAWADTADGGDVANAAATRDHVVTGDVGGLDPARIDMEKTGTVTVHKVVPNPLNNGQHGPMYRGVVGRPLTLVRFKGFDLTTKAGWEKAKSFTLSEAMKVAGIEGVDEVTKTTDRNGDVRFDGVAPGVYLLSENIAGDASGSFYNTTPELFTVPIGNNGRWSYSFSVVSKDQIEHAPIKPVSPVPGSSAGVSLIPLIIGGTVFGSFIPSLSAGASVPPKQESRVPKVLGKNPAPSRPQKGLEKTLAKSPSSVTKNPPSALAMTGADVSGPLAWGLLAAALGGVLVGCRRRARR